MWLSKNILGIYVTVDKYLRDYVTVEKYPWDLCNRIELHSKIV